MEKSNTLLGDIVSFTQDHSKGFATMGVVAGAVLVIYYCSSINFYPSGLTVADTLFFLWSVAVFGFYYSVLVFVFFIASLFWVSILAISFNLINKKLSKKVDLTVPFPRSELFIIFSGGLIANVVIIVASMYKDHSLMLIFGSMSIIGLIYTLIENVSSKENYEHSFLDSNGNPIYKKAINQQTIKYIFYLFIYSVPLIVGQVGGGLARTTFETMGVRKANVSISIESENYKEIIEKYKNDKLISNVSCNTVCTFQNANVLFTSIGTKTKIQAYGDNGHVNLVFPSKIITLFSEERINDPAVKKANK